MLIPDHEPHLSPEDHIEVLGGTAFLVNQVALGVEPFLHKFEIEVPLFFGDRLEEGEPVETVLADAELGEELL